LPAAEFAAQSRHPPAMAEHGGLALFSLHGMEEPAHFIYYLAPVSAARQGSFESLRYHGKLAL